MKVYYAHCMAIYNTPQEMRDVMLLAALGFEVENPNRPAVDALVSHMKAEGADFMNVFRDLISRCDLLVFRALPDGRIPAGVYKEVMWAREFHLPVLELPGNLLGRPMTVEQTREYLAETGQR